MAELLQNFDMRDMPPPAFDAGEWDSLCREKAASDKRYGRAAPKAPNPYFESRQWKTKAPILAAIVEGAKPEYGAKRLGPRQAQVLSSMVSYHFAKRGRADFDGTIHPGIAALTKKKLAMSRSTVTRALKLLSDLGFITAKRYAKGGSKATRYAVNLSKIHETYFPLPICAEGELVPMDRWENQFSEFGSEFDSTASFCITDSTEAEASNFPVQGEEILVVSSPLEKASEPEAQQALSRGEELSVPENETALLGAHNAEEGLIQRERISHGLPKTYHARRLGAKPHRKPSVSGQALSRRRQARRRPMNAMFPPRKLLRPHQERLLDGFRSRFALHERRVCGQLATGGGKTLTASYMLHPALAKGWRCMFTAPFISLIDQTWDAFWAEGIRDMGVAQASHVRTDPSAQLQIASVQTLAKRGIPDDLRMVIVDEAHIRSEVIDQLMLDRPDMHIIGLSATPWRKGMGAPGMWQSLVVGAGVSDLIEAGYLSDFIAYEPNTPDLSGVRIEHGEYVTSDLERVMSEPKLVGNILQNWLENGENRPTLAFAVSVAQSRALAAQFNAAGVAAAHVDAGTDRIIRRDYAQELQSGELKVLFNVRTLTTGVDIPEVSCIIDAYPTRSPMLHLQKLGRGLRIKPQGGHCVIFDHAGNCGRLGQPDAIIRTTLDTRAPDEKGPAELPPDKPTPLPKPCPKCAALMTGRLCKACGYERLDRVAETQEGELIAMPRKSKKAPPPTHEEKQRFWSMALWLMNSRGKSRGAVSHLYRERFGVWPINMSDTPVPAEPDVLNFEKSRRIAYAKAREAERNRNSSPEARI